MSCGRSQCLPVPQRLGECTMASNPYVCPARGYQIETSVGAADDRPQLRDLLTRHDGPSVRHAVRAGVFSCNHDLLVGIPRREGVLDQVTHQDSKGIQVYSRP